MLASATLRNIFDWVPNLAGRMLCLLRSIVVKNVFYVFFYFSLKHVFNVFILCMFFFISKNTYNILNWPKEP